MTSDDLTPEHTEKLMRSVGKYLRYLDALQTRMNRLAFPPNDPLFSATLEARNAAAHLYVAAHYASCKQGVAKSSQCVVAMKDGQASDPSF